MNVHSAWPFDMAANQHHIHPRTCSEMRHAVFKACPALRDGCYFLISIIFPASVPNSHLAIHFSPCACFVSLLSTSNSSRPHPPSFSHFQLSPVSQGSLSHISLHSSSFLAFSSLCNPLSSALLPPTPPFSLNMPRPTAFPSLPQLIYHPSVSDWSGWTPHQVNK